MAEIFQARFFSFTAPSTYDCHFESGLCTWTQAKDDQFDWTRTTGGTGTGQTGPSNDHTHGDSKSDCVCQIFRHTAKKYIFDMM